MQIRPDLAMPINQASKVLRSAPAHGLPHSGAMVVIARKVRVAVTPRDRLLKARLASGAVVYGKNRAGFGGRGVYIYGDKSEPEFEHLDQFLDKTGVFIEVGANTGKHSIKAAKHYSGDGVVIAIEPNPDVLSILHRSVVANGLGNVRLRNFCIGASRSSEIMWMNNSKPVMFSLLKNDEGAEGFSTLTLTLDELFEWEGLDRLDFLKICAEGAEGRVLAGGRDTITRYRPIIEIESVRVDAPVEQRDYTCFKAPLPSMSKFWMPNEHPKIDIARSLWPEVSAINLP
jgi:FkbM family methyltransferase